jgi:hypothetical protein
MSLSEALKMQFGGSRQGLADEAALSAMPSSIANRPGHSPFDLHAISIPAGALTGDFYFTRQFDHELWIALGDVAGKGLEAAIYLPSASSLPVTAGEIATTT